MKKFISNVCICLTIILSCLLYTGCKEETVTNINIKGIYLSSSNANNNNVYGINFLMIEILDFENNNSYVIYNGNDLSYKIEKPKEWVIENKYLLPNEKSIVSIKGNQFKLIVSLNIDYNGEEIKFSQNATININYSNEQLNLKNADYNKLLASLLDFTFDLDNGQKESISLILNAEQIKN